MLKLAKTIYNFLDSVSSEVSYWQQIQNLETELDQTSNALSSTRENEEALRVDNLKLMSQNKALKDEVEDSKAAYQSLLFDYFEMVKKYRLERMRSLDELHEAHAKIDGLENHLFSRKF